MAPAARLLWTVVLLSAPTASSAAADQPWRAGAAAVDISPREPVWLAGYAARAHASEGVSQRIHAKALALEDAGGRKLVIVTSDLLGFTAALADPIAERLAARTGLRREELLLTSSHTHTAPVVRDYMVFAYGMGAAQEAVVERYSRFLVDRVVEVVEAALKRRAPARLAFGRGRAGFLVNRRVLGPRGVTFGENDSGPIDPEVPVLRVEGTNGKLRAVLFGFACHNTTLTGAFYRVDGDYAGYAQAGIERAHRGARALFVAGFAGDANPRPRGTVEHARAHGKELYHAVESVLRAPMADLPPELAVAFDRVDLPFAAPPGRDELEKRVSDRDVGRQRHARRMLELIERDGGLPVSYAAPVHVARLGRELLLVALGGEVVVDYSIRLRHELEPRPLFLVAYANDVFAYVPSVRILEEGGYEGGGSMTFYGRPGPWDRSVEEILIAKVRSMVERVSPR
jgi:hypothetical protein